MIFNGVGAQVFILPNAGGIDTDIALTPVPPQQPPNAPAPPLGPGNPMEVWVQNFVTLANAVPLTTARTALRATIGAWSRRDAIAASILQRGIDFLTPAPQLIATNAMATFADVPRSAWWRLFIDRNKQDTPANALVFDYQESPGYYHAMMNAFDQVLVANGAHALPANAAWAVWYDRLHQDVVQGVLHPTGPNAWALVGNVVSGNGGATYFGMGREPDPVALRELADEGVLGRLGEAGVFTCRYSAGGNRIRTDYNVNGVALLVTNQFTPYNGQRNAVIAAAAALSAVATTYSTLAGQARTAAATTAGLGAAGDPNAIALAGKAALRGLDRSDELRARADAQKVRGIAKLIRALHVGHYYTDANGRLNTMLLLNRILQIEGYSLVIMDDTSVFGGALSLNSLADAIVYGQRVFQGNIPRL